MVCQHAVRVLLDLRVLPVSYYIFEVFKFGMFSPTTPIYGW